MPPISNVQDLFGRIQCINADQDDLSEGCWKARQANRSSQGTAGGAPGSTPAANLRSAADSTAVAKQALLAEPATPNGGLDSIGNRIAGRAFQDKVAALCGALVKTGVFDGCMLDLWNDQWDNKQNYAQESAARLPLIQKIRAAVGDKAIPPVRFGVLTAISDRLWP